MYYGFVVLLFLFVLCFVGDFGDGIDDCFVIGVVVDVFGDGFVYFCLVG